MEILGYSQGRQISVVFFDSIAAKITPANKMMVIAFDWHRSAP